MGDLCNEFVLRLFAALGNSHFFFFFFFFYRFGSLCDGQVGMSGQTDGQTKGNPRVPPFLNFVETGDNQKPCLHDQAYPKQMKSVSWQCVTVCSTDWQEADYQNVMVSHPQYGRCLLCELTNSLLSHWIDITTWANLLCWRSITYIWFWLSSSGFGRGEQEFW